MTSVDIADNELDLRGLVCPMPVLRVKKALKPLASCEELTVITDDPHAPADIRTFAEQSGHEVVLQEEVAPGVVRHRLRHRV